MELETIEKDDRLMVDVKQNHTLGNLIRKAVWENGGEAAYDKGHPLGDESTLIIEGDELESTLEDAVETAREWMEEIEDQL
ncbi:MAG: RpoL/Rpb11 RNA polymerase subunit family protein [Candidatus Nanohaloarchaea archaeon]